MIIVGKVVTIIGTILGCTDSTSNLYNPWATDDDGSCVSALDQRL